MNKLDMSKEREAFEAWSVRFNTRLLLDQTYGEYDQKSTQSAWEAWLARAQLDSGEWERKREGFVQIPIDFLKEYKELLEGVEYKAIHKMVRINAVDALLEHLAQPPEETK